MDMTIYVIAILFVCEGIMNALGVFVPFQKSGFKNYTEESVKAWLKPNGVINIIMGIGLALFNGSVFGNLTNSIFMIVGAALLSLGLIGTIVNIKKNLVKVQ
ncbi:MAG: hypothetical protein RR929_04840 [Erysipelotrichaceae bacterium]